MYRIYKQNLLRLVAVCVLECRPMVEKEWIVPKDAAKILECTADTIRRYLRNGTLQGRKTGRWRVYVPSIQKLLAPPEEVKR